jgi:nucleoid-associated protein YgaU
VAERVRAGQGIGAWPVCGAHMKGGTTAVAAQQRAVAPAPARYAAPKHYAAPIRQWTPKAAPAPIQRVAPKALPYQVPAATGGVYTVRPGDTLAKIAQAHGVSSGWRGLWALNRGTVANPNLIFVGQTLHL